ncbi:response regulator transcription factor [Pseudorhodoferax sp.]|uniref:response regulator transcription factor n=1 Tax=Pseudorhodoferax sp. TaxID=1993553 RepID=UPI002DD61CE0|nr:response regulator transcription factor [Pseudorhodoferax sp.]
MTSHDVAALPHTIVLADAQPLLRMGVATLIDAQRDLRVVGQAGSAAELTAQCALHRPQIVCVDLALLDPLPEQGIAALRHLPQAPRVVVLTQRNGEEDIYRALRAGASAYLFKDVPSDELLQGLRTVGQGGSFVPPPVAARLTARLHGEVLSPREMQILQQVAAGHSNKRIGLTFGISDGTVKSHTKRIFCKLGVSSRTGAVATAVQRGLIAL